MVRYFISFLVAPLLIVSANAQSSFQQPKTVVVTPAAAAPQRAVSQPVVTPPINSVVPPHVSWQQKQKDYEQRQAAQLLSQQSTANDALYRFCREEKNKKSDRCKGFYYY